MKSEDDYVTVRIPRQLANEIDELILSETLRYRSRAEMVNEAIRIRIRLLGLNKGIDDDLSNYVKETFRVHTIINMAKEKKPTPSSSRSEAA